MGTSAMERSGSVGAGSAAGAVDWSRGGAGWGGGEGRGGCDGLSGTVRLRNLRMAFHQSINQSIKQPINQINQIKSNGRGGGAPGP